MKKGSMKGCDFRDRWDDVISQSLDAETQAAWKIHCESCGECREMGDELQILMPLVAMECDSLAEEPTPFFFARQFSAIERRIEARESASLWQRLLQYWRAYEEWKENLSRPMVAFALILMMAVSWATFSVGHSSPLAELRSTGQVVADVFFHDGGLSLISESLFGEHLDDFAMLF